MSRGARAVFFLLLSCACISTNRAIRPGGDAVRIILKNGARYHAELLAVTVADLYFLSDQHVWRSPLADSTRVRVEGYNLRTWKYVTLSAIGAVDAVIGLYSADICCLPFAFVPLPFLVGGAWWALRDEPRIDFRFPLTDSRMAQLALYCRYPQGLTDAQWQELLRFYHQDTFLSPGDLPKP
jgi:hypothetical protein